MSGAAHDDVLKHDADSLRRSWHVAPKPPPPRGWLVYSETFVLRVLQGRYGRPDEVRTSAGWRAAARVLRAAMAAAQVLLMLWARTPLLSALLEVTATHWGRGSLGFFLRACYWKARLGRLGQDTLIDRGVSIWGAASTFIGSCCHIDSDVRLAAGEAGQGQRGRIEIGDYTHVGPRCNVAGRGGVTIGDFVSIQGLVHVYSATTTLIDPRAPGRLPSLSHMAPPDFQHVLEAPVVVGDYASIGFASLLLPGCSLGRGVIVHPYSQVSGAFEDYANVVGPGRARQNGWRVPLRVGPRG